jgi:hypothetical protein
MTDRSDKARADKIERALADWNHKPTGFWFAVALTIVVSVYLIVQLAIANARF